jgi:hypothetical protein
LQLPKREFGVTHEDKEKIQGSLIKKIRLAHVRIMRVKTKVPTVWLWTGDDYSVLLFNANLELSFMNLSLGV